MPKIDKKTAIKEYREAYMRVHGTEPSIEEKRGGWFVIQGGSPWRLSSLVEMTKILRSRAEGAGEESGKD